MVKDFETSIYTRDRIDTPKRAEEILRAICRYDDFTPEKWSWGSEPVKNIFFKDDLAGPIKALLNRDSNERNPENLGGELLMKRIKKPRSWYTPKWQQKKFYPFGISSYHTEENYIKNKRNSDKWLDFSDKLFMVQKGWFGYMSTENEIEYKFYVDYKRADGLIGKATVGTQLQENIPGVFWGNYFGKFYIDWFGREKFDSLPCIKKKELPDGSIFFTTAESPWDWDTDECKKLQRKVMDHLGKDAFFDKEDLKKKIHEYGTNGLVSIEQFVPKHKIPDFPFKFEKRRWTY